MASPVWSRDDIRNVLLAIYAVKLPSEEGPATEGSAEAEAARLYRWGSRVAIQALMLAFGLPLQLLDRQAQLPSLPAADEQDISTDHWRREDMENIIAAVYRSAIATPIHDPSSPHIQYYRQGFTEVIESFLQAIGSHADHRQWLAQTLADRYWVFSEEAPTKLFGAPDDRTEPHQDQD